MLVGRFCKETTDVSRFTIDASQWLDANETISGYTVPLITLVVPNFPGPVGFANQPLYVSQPAGVAPPDLFPLVIEAQFNIDTGLEFFVGAGTPGLTYQFQLTLTGTSTRKQTVEVFINIVSAPGVPYPVAT